jgi:hypothetical protein
VYACERVVSCVCAHGASLRSTRCLRVSCTRCTRCIRVACLQLAQCSKRFVDLAHWRRLYDDIIKATGHAVDGRPRVAVVPAASSSVPATATPSAAASAAASTSASPDMGARDAGTSMPSMPSMLSISAAVDAGEGRGGVEGASDTPVHVLVVDTSRRSSVSSADSDGSELQQHVLALQSTGYDETLEVTALRR